MKKLAGILGLLTLVLAFPATVALADEGHDHHHHNRHHHEERHERRHHEERHERHEHGDDEGDEDDDTVITTSAGTLSALNRIRVESVNR